ncbi:hypothetical protein BD324DRAFT_577344 [Kockovaella imperatae]|uniref:non-specific serine/threonine protein kinase n=1 Tax=Kockovaella imperatae TaxID=4999 RepID=A0A1Y1UMU7_9TREE|nr:hypothetical protein BD324DRAFT_577344 [Kockovaella imperatae]ORX39339.1 hypothetical protein BD324DRAFT_577344 [Kockovaella imperatae]
MLTCQSTAGSTAPTPLPPVTPAVGAPNVPRDHPLIAEILARNLQVKTRSVQYAWTHTLMTSPHDNPSVWLHQLYQATLEASAVPEILITAKDVVDTTLVSLLSDPVQTQEIACVFLDLVAFFDKERKPLPQAILDAAKGSALKGFGGDLENPLPAICVWYAEQQAEGDLSSENIANLVEANIRIGYDSAWSSLLWRRDEYGEQPKPFWITQLSHWQTALDEQDRIDGTSDAVSSFDSFNTRLICHHALGQFEKGYNLAQRLFEGLTDSQRRRVSHWACAAAWHMGDYEAMADFNAFHPKGTSKSLYKAIIDVHHGQYASAFHHISKSQSLSYDELQAQLEVGPQIAIKTLAKTECLVELQEVIQYKSQPGIQKHLQSVWKNRFKRSHAEANTWLKRLQIWKMACPPTEIGLQRCYLDAAKLCESSGMHEAAQKLLEWVKPETHPPGCKVQYTQMRFDWKEAAEKQDLTRMKDIVSRLHNHTARYLESVAINREELESEGLGLRPLASVQDVDASIRNILARRYYRLAQWTELSQGGFWLTDPTSEVYNYYSLAYKLDDLWFNGAYSLAQAAMNIFETGSHSQKDRIAINSYVVPAIRGLFQAVRSRETPEKMIKALLRLVTLWFRYGESESVLAEVQHQLSATAISAWLMAIPQLIARLGTLHPELQALLIDLLKDIARQFPHAAIWPLLTASQTQKVEHERAARMIMDHICQMQDGTTLVNQAELVGRELIRTSISWMEKWRNLIDRSLPRQDLMEIAWHEVPQAWEAEIQRLAEPETPDEEHFVQSFGPQLHSIYKVLLKYQQTKQLSLVNTAYSDLELWPFADIDNKLYGELDAQVNQWRQPGSKLQLASTAPRLLAIRECILTVPGQYDPNVNLDDQAFIEAFMPVVDVLATKQIPRKLIITSLRKDYTFLLKGNEDLRGDERIMQLFTLINTLLNHNSEAFGRNLHLLPYEVIPLSPSAGLVSWVENTQQLQAIILSNREKCKASNLSNKELASILGYDPENFDTKHDRPKLDPPAEMDRYDKLPLPTKVERLKAALSHSKQTDLKEVLWSRSPSAEIWIHRRTNFARTIGIGSFVGYVIGLGDRHGSNILVNQLTWGALHIDFGDLFGVAQERSFLPEKVPFRLTRMMTNAMELACSQGHVVPGSRGSFKQASTICMGVLRESRSTLLAMLEAFLYDPLLSWTVSHLHDSVLTAPGQCNAIRADHSNEDIYNHIDNSLISMYLDTDSYMAKASTGITNSKALHVLTQIERKLAGYGPDKDHKDTILSVKHQVQGLIEEATSVENLAQGYVLGWLPYW